MHCYSEVKTELGTFRVACSSNGIAMICLARGAPAAFEDEYQKCFGVRPQASRIPESFERAVVRAAAGRAFDPVPIDLSGVSGFQLKVLNALRRVPRGEVRTYAWLATKVGKPKAARAVGNTMAHNPVPILVPCHRVVPASGGVGNYGLGPALKRELLAREGVEVDQL
jgi:O-6-methylguanine DNA methyltransferase